MLWFFILFCRLNFIVVIVEGVIWKYLVFLIVILVDNVVFLKILFVKVNVVNKIIVVINILSSVNFLFLFIRFEYCIYWKFMISFILFYSEGVWYNGWFCVYGIIWFFKFKFFKFKICDLIGNIDFEYVVIKINFYRIVVIICFII